MGIEQTGSGDEDSPKPSVPIVKDEAPFRLNVKRNYKGDYGFEYTIRGDTIIEIQQHNYDINQHLFEQGLIARAPKKPGATHENP